MEKEVLSFIKSKNLFKPDEVVGVACSGGEDSMCLLHFLNSHKEDLEISVVAVTVDHMLRGEESEKDATFVQNFCKDKGISCLRFNVDAKALSERKKVGVEEGARLARYSVFDRILEEKKVDKIALAHHLSDQAETILMHILRGSGLGGACGMKEAKDGLYVRPFLNVSKEEIKCYNQTNNISFVEDQTNLDSSYNRNFLRNKVFPLLKERWKGVEKSLVSFGKACREDNDFILGEAKHDGVIVNGSVAKIPLVYFLYKPSIINRIIFETLKKIGVKQDIERKHIELIKSLEKSNNGKKINLPNDLVAQKEYDYLTLFVEQNKVICDVLPFKTGKQNFGNIYEIMVKKSNKVERMEGALTFDSALLPKNCVWRVRKIGDKITKFGGGTKTLKNFLIDKKIPKRLRDNLPVLACENEIFCVLGVEISDKVKITENTKNVFNVSFKEIK